MKTSYKSLKSKKVIIIPLLLFVVNFSILVAQETEKEEEQSKFLNTYSFFKNSRYNRVEGLFLGFELETIPIKYPDFTFFTRWGYGIGNQRLRYSLKIQKKFSGENKISLFFKQETESNDHKIIGNVENSLSSLLARRDFRDYFSIKSVGLEFIPYLNDKFNIGFNCDLKRYKPLHKTTDWSLFNSEKFRENLFVLPGNEIYVSVSLSSNIQESFIMPLDQWHYNLILEKGSDDFNHFGAGINIKRYQLLFESHIFVANLLIHSRTKTAAEQHLIDLGGVSTLRGYAHKEFTGNRIFLLNFDYFFGRSILQKLPLSFIPFYDMLDLIFFFDAGKANVAETEDNIFQGFNGGGIYKIENNIGCIYSYSNNKFKSNIGAAVSLGQGFLRFNFARRLDRKNDNFTFSLRLMRNL